VIATTEPMLVILAIGCLILALLNMRSQGLTFESKAWMGVTWLLIIAVVAFIAGRFSV
jgi:uncharacterized membrane protein